MCHCGTLTYTSRYDIAIFLHRSGPLLVLVRLQHTSSCASPRRVTRLAWQSDRGSIKVGAAKIDCSVTAGFGRRVAAESD